MILVVVMGLRVKTSALAMLFEESTGHQVIGWIEESLWSLWPCSPGPNGRFKKVGRWEVWASLEALQSTLEISIFMVMAAAGNELSPGGFTFSKVSSRVRVPFPELWPTMLLVQYLGTDKTTLIHFLIQTASHHLPMDSPVFKKKFFFLLLFLLPFSALPPPLCSYTSHHCWILMILLRFHQAALSQFHVFVHALKTFHSRIGFTPSLKKTFSDTSLSMPCFFSLFPHWLFSDPSLVFYFPHFPIWALYF